MPDKPPKPPKQSAPVSEHKKFAKEALAYEPYKREPEGGMHPSDIPPGEKANHKPDE